MAEERSTEVVPGMAEAIESRMLELGLGPGKVAALAGITPQGLMPIRKGWRRSYQTALKVGVARALEWENDAIDRLMRGEEPTPAGGQEPPPGASLALAALVGEIAPEDVAEAQRRLQELIDRRRS